MELKIFETISTALRHMPLKFPGFVTYSRRFPLNTQKFNTSHEPEVRSLPFRVFASNLRSSFWRAILPTAFIGASLQHCVPWDRVFVSSACTSEFQSAGNTIVLAVDRGRPGAKRPRGSNQPRRWLTGYSLWPRKLLCSDERTGRGGEGCGEDDSRGAARLNSWESPEYWRSATDGKLVCPVYASR